MTTLSPRPAADSASRCRQRLWAVLVLAVLAPFTVDVLFGGTSITNISGVLSEISTYGFAAVLIRAVVRRRVLGFRSIVLFGLAFALTTEFLIVQTSLAPLGSLVPYPDYGRAMGVNWPFLVWALGYETLWGIAMPITLAELAFPLHRTSAWLGVRGCVVLTLLFVLGAGAVWYDWTQLSSPDYVHLPVYLPPLLTVLCGWVVVLMFVSPAHAVAVRRNARFGRVAYPPIPGAAGARSVGGRYRGGPGHIPVVRVHRHCGRVRCLGALGSRLCSAASRGDPGRGPRRCRGRLDTQARLVGYASTRHGQRCIADQHGGGFWEQ